MGCIISTLFTVIIINMIRSSDFSSGSYYSPTVTGLSKPRLMLDGLKYNRSVDQIVVNNVMDTLFLNYLIKHIFFTSVQPGSTLIKIYLQYLRKKLTSTSLVLYHKILTYLCFCSCLFWSIGSQIVGVLIDLKWCCILMIWIYHVMFYKILLSKWITIFITIKNLFN